MGASATAVSPGDADKRVVVIIAWLALRVER
jgi:hypothetical protein